MNLNNITINTQSSIKIEGSKILYFDSFKIETETHDADIIFITHEHFDHFEPESIAKIKKEGTILVTPKSMKDKALSESGIAPEKCVFLEPYEKHEQEGILIEAVPAYNKLKPFHPKSKKWNGYIVTIDNIRYYVSGDTDVNDAIKKVQCDVALIPIGGHYTMDKAKAADYIAALKPNAVIPTHYGTIIGNQSDGAEFKKLLESLNKDIQVELKLPMAD